MRKIDLYIRCVERLQRRYTKGGRLVVKVGGEPSRYTLLERRVWDKYMS